MEPQFLVPETIVHQSGESAPIAIGGPPRPESLLVTLGVTRVVEQEALLVSLHGSPDGVAWSPAALASFPQKFYKSISTLLIPLASHPEVAFIRARWKVNRWGRGDMTPEFAFYVFVEPA